MLSKDLIELIQEIRKNGSEDNRIEIKKAAGGCPKIYDTLSSFSNQSGGGVIIFGIDQDNDFDLCGVYDADDLQKNIVSMCKQMTPVVRPVCTVATIDDKVFVSAEIQEIDMFEKPCFYTGAGRLKGSYIRVGDSDEHMTEYEIYSYEAFRKKIQDEIRVESRAEIEDIDTDSFAYYLTQLRRTKPQQGNLATEKVMKLQGFSDGQKPTLAGTIPQMLEEALGFIRRNIKVRTIIDSATGKREDKPEYPIVALREVILNALIHRDYSIHTDLSPVTIRIFKNRIEVENPGGLYGRMTMDELGKTIADTRNPFIAKAMEVIGETENRFSGIPIIRRLMAEYHLPEPLFESRRGIFKVTLFNHQESTEKTNENSLDNQILEFCSVWRTRAELKEQFSHLTSSYLMSYFVNPLVAQGRIELRYPDKPRSKKQEYKAI